MNFRHLAAFRALMECASVTEAAKKLHITQPALSRMIMALEQELDVKLFHRQRKRLLPTAGAERIYREAQRILAAVDDIGRLAQDIRSHVGSRLRVVTIPRAARCLVVPALRRFSEIYPAIHHSVEVQARVDMELWINRQQFDVGIGALPAVHEALLTEELCDVPLAVVMSPEHRYANWTQISVEDLLDEPLIALKPGYMLRRHVDQMFEQAGATPTIRTECGNSMLACQLAGAGVGVTICDLLSMRTINESGATIVPIEPEYKVTFGILYPVAKEPDEVTLAFTEILREVVNEELARIGL